jgi:hypothetical protein
MTIIEQTVTHIYTTTAPLDAIEEAARECYQSKKAATPLEQER